MKLILSVDCARFGVSEKSVKEIYLNGLNELMGNIYTSSINDNGLHNGGLCGLLTVLRSSRLFFMSNTFVSLTAALNIEYESISPSGGFVHDFVTHLSKSLFRYGFDVVLEEFLALLDFTRIRMGQRVLCV